MSKLTKEERQWLHDKFYGTDIGVSEDSFDYFLKEIEQKKKEWQKEAYQKGYIDANVVTLKLFKEINDQLEKVNKEIKFNF